MSRAAEDTVTAITATAESACTCEMLVKLNMLGECQDPAEMLITRQRTQTSPLVRDTEHWLLKTTTMLWNLIATQASAIDTSQYSLI